MQGIKMSHWCLLLFHSLLLHEVEIIIDPFISIVSYPRSVLHVAGLARVHRFKIFKLKKVDGKWEFMVSKNKPSSWTHSVQPDRLAAIASAVQACVAALNWRDRCQLFVRWPTTS
jgi:hypothetical protein